jgi:hypothetical protein
MSDRAKFHLQVLGVIVGVLFAASIGILSTAEPASPVDSTAGPIAVSVSPTSGLTDGQVVSIHAQAAPGSDLYEIRTHLCRPGAVIENTVDFDFDGPNCSPTPVSPNADYETIVTIPPGTGGTGDATFRVGVGSGGPWGDMFGGNHTITCGPDAPCSLVVQLQVPNNTVFSVVPLCFGNCPDATPAAPPPGAASSGGGASGAAPTAAENGAAPTGTGQATGQAAASGAGPSNPAAGGGSSRGATETEVASARARGGGGGGDGVLATVVGSPIAHRAARVFAGGVAGVVGGCLIALIIIRARRRMAESGIA